MGSAPQAAPDRRATVALVACRDYDRARVEAAVTRCLELTGFASDVRAAPVGRAMLKPNLLVPAAPDRAVTTHPEVVRAVIANLRETASEVVVGDCPMFAKPESTLKACGLLAVMDELGARPADMASTAVIQGREGRRFKRFEVARVACEADLFVNLCKLKTHGLSGLTLSIKNLLGLIPGLEKSKWHLKASSPDEFVSMLVDLLEAFQLARASEPRGRVLHLCDAVVGMEGEGPGPAGTPRPIGVIAASTDAVALDAVLARVAGLDVDDVLTTPLAAARGLGVADLSRIDVVGDRLDDVALAPGALKLNRGSLRSGVKLASWPFTARFIRDRMVERPRIVTDRCTGCGECRKVCAAGAIALAGDPKRSRIDAKTCIRCYCCIEVCPAAAARLGPRPLVARAADNLHLLPWVAAGLGLIAAGGAAWAWLW
jgi:uncharacterized protein (DUF362 family)/ferredoxin